MVRMDSHHLKLYSEYWTTLSGDGEGRVFGFGGSALGEVEKQISPLRCAPVEMTQVVRLCSGRNDDVLREASRDIWLRLPPGITMDYSLL